MLWRVVLVLGLLWPLRASAQSSGSELFRLSWSVPDECPSDTEVRQEVQRLLGASTASPGGRVDATARVSAVKGGFELEIALGQDDQLRTRRLAAPHCEELGHAAALIVALAVDPSLTIGEGEKLSEVVPAPCPAPPATMNPTSPGPAPRCPVCPGCAAPTPDWHTAVLLAVSISYGELPQALPRVSVGAAYRTDPHWLELVLSGAFASTGFRSDGRGATLWQWYATPRYCVQARFGTTRVGPCASTEVGLIKAAGFGVEQPKTQRTWWVAPGLGLQAGWRLQSGAELQVGADLLVAATRTSFKLDSEQLFRPHLVIPALRLALVGGLF
jgi:hypothetical protein